jgi:Ca-activated chloride channel family protein
MTLLAPTYLWLLGGVAAVVAVYVILRVRRRAYAARFATAETLPYLIPRRTGWRRHLSTGLMSIALVSLVVGLARPARAERVARKEATVMLVMDVSASMEAIDVSPSRLVAAKAAASDFVEKLPEDFEVGLVSFAGAAHLLSAPTKDRAVVLGTLESLQTDRGTAAGDGIIAALDAIAAQAATQQADKVEGVPARIVLLSDGLASVGTAGTPIAEAVAKATEQSVPITTISFGTANGTIMFDGGVLPVPADGALLSEIAKETGGTAFEATTADQLRSVYQDVGRRISYTTEQRDLALLFVAVGLVLVVLALGSSMVLTGRPV